MCRYIHPSMCVETSHPNLSYHCHLFLKLFTSLLLKKHASMGILGIYEVGKTIVKKSIHQI